jgi:hypothetical protein
MGFRVIEQSDKDLAPAAPPKYRRGVLGHLGHLKTFTSDRPVSPTAMTNRQFEQSLNNMNQSERVAEIVSNF